MTNNKLIIAAAGSGKTTFLVDEALKKQNSRILITTYTEANETEIRKKIIEKNKCIPENITIQTWFSFLLEHGARPFQGVLFKQDIKGMLLVNEQSGFRYRTKEGIPVYFKEESELDKHYLTLSHKIYSDKLSKFVIRCNEKSDGAVIDRLSKIYTHIFIDEVQDLAGYDLDILKLFFSSSINTFLVGDPRQVVYLTHNERKWSKYIDGKIKDFISNECKKYFDKDGIDDTTLKYSHRNNKDICSFSSKLYSDFPANEPCSCLKCRSITDHEGIFLVKKSDIQAYLSKYPSLMQLKLRSDTKDVFQNLPNLNFGLSKGLSFDRVLIYPTINMQKWVVNNKLSLAGKTRAQLYVAITRARHSVGIVYDYDENTLIDGVGKYMN